MTARGPGFGDPTAVADANTDHVGADPGEVDSPPSSASGDKAQDWTAPHGRRLPALTDRALRRLRALEAAVLLAGLASRHARGVRQDLPLALLVGLALVHLSVTSAVSLAAAHARSETIRARFEQAELGLDVVLAGAVVMGFGLRADSLLFAVPLFCVLHASLRFRLSGAALTWGLLAVAALGASLRLPDPWSSSSGPGSLLEPLALLLLVGLPTGYLAEYLLAELADLRGARRDLERRATLLSSLIAAGCELIGADRRRILSRTATVALSLGFDEVVVQRWNRHRGIWEPAARAGPARFEDDLHRDGGDPSRHGPDVPPRPEPSLVWPSAADASIDAWSESSSDSSSDETSSPLRPFDRTPDPTPLTPPSGLAPWEVRVLSRHEADLELRIQPQGGHLWAAITSLTWGEEGEGARIIAWSNHPLGSGDARSEALAVLAAQAAAALANASLHQDLAGLKDEFEHRALHDSLTGLANRARLLAEIDWHLRANRTAALVFCDLDGFKDINDTHGHHIGDAVLVAVARRLSAVAGKEGLVARLGGDEFVMVVPDATIEGVLRGITERIVAQLSMPVTVEDLVVPVGVSLGVARVEPGDVSASQVLERADAAMYATKRLRRPKLNQRVAPDQLAGDFPAVASLKGLADAIRVAPADDSRGNADNPVPSS